jgi:hypothetical protein
MMDTSTSNPASYAFLAMIGLLAVFASNALYKKYNNDIDNDLPEYPSAFLAHGLLWSGILTIIASLFSGLIGVPGYILSINATIAISGAGIIFAIRRLTWDIRLAHHDAVKALSQNPPPAASPSEAAEG